MKPFYVKIPNDYVNIYPFGDIHKGSPQCDEDLLKRYVEEIYEDKYAKWFGLGDLVENALPTSLGDMYQQIEPPEVQMQHMAKLLDPIKDKGLFMIMGNHEDRTYKRCGVHPESLISALLGVNPKTGEPYVPFLGLTVYAVIALDVKPPNQFKIFVHHNTGGGATIGGKTNKAVKLEALCPSADAIFSGHTHITSRVSRQWFDTTGKNIIEKNTMHYVCGSTLKYEGSYAEQKALLPACRELIKVRFSARNNGHMDSTKQEYFVIR